jgi:hypothetical protein
MNRFFRFTSLVVSAAAFGASYAQTPAQMEYERQQREYWRQQEQQRQEQQRQQQLMQDNARRQQEESSRLNAGTGQGGQGATPGRPSPGGGASQGAADKLSAARARWEKQPPLPADRNPLLGKWTRPTSPRTNPSDPFAGLVALAKGGMCEVLFGGGVFEFRADKLVGMDERTPEQELDKVEYRGDAKHVVVLPKTTLKLIEFDFEGPNRISWTGQNCVLVRVGSTPAGASATPAKVATASAPSTAAAPNSGGVLALSFVSASPGTKVAGRKLWVLKEDAQVALIKGGLKSTPDGSALQNWMRACQSRTPDCAKGAGALNAYTVGIATTDASGRAQTPQLPAGRYWVLSDAKVDNRHVMWNEPVDVRNGEKSLTLDERNAKPVN